MRRARALESEERSATSYARAAAVIKGAHSSACLSVRSEEQLKRVFLAYPHRISSVEQVKSLPFIGPKLSKLVRRPLADAISELR